MRSLKEGGRILAQIIREVSAAAKPGVTTRDLETLTNELLLRHNVRSSFLGYMRYPSVICLSVNDEAVHAVPSDRVLNVGDLLKIDMGVVYDGFHTDSAVTLLVGDDGRKEFAERRKLIAVTRQALAEGIAHARVGNTLGDIGAAVQKVVQDGGFTILQELGGHGIGRELHEDPFIANFGKPGKGEKLSTGMVLALEPITSMGDWRIKDGQDGFGYLASDGSLSAHFEHTVIVGENGPEIVTV